MKNRVCQFGIFKPTYTRNRVLALGFEKNGYEVIQVNIDPAVGRIKKFFQLYKEYKQLENKKFDYVIVSYPGHTVVWLARFLFGKNIIFDAFLSLYDSNVQDRKLYSKWGLMGMWNWFLDWYSCTIAEFVLLDTYEHISYFHNTFGIPKKKFIRVLVGSTEDLLKKEFEPKNKESFIVHFHGNYIPLHGAEYIIEAANILRNENIIFQLVGTGGMRQENLIKKVRNLGIDKKVRMIGKVPFDELILCISGAHICLGIFGNTEKTQRVIPNKLYEYLGSGKASITADTPAVRELLTDRENVLFSNVADGEDLAKKILLLKNDENLRKKIAKQGHEIFLDKVTPRRVVERLIVDLEMRKS